MGKFSYVSDPGIHFVCCPFQTMEPVTIQVQQQTVNTDTKTHDNVTVTVKSAIQFSVEPTKVNDYYFKLSNPWQQMAAHVENIVRGHIPKMELDDVYAAKTKLADEIKADLSKSMSPYGIKIHSCLMTDIIPDQNVLQAMNEINSAKRNREANIQKTEADKLTTVKIAESKAESQLLAADADAKAVIRKAEGEATAALRRAEGNALAVVKLAQAEAEVQRLTGLSIAKMQEASGLDGRQVAHLMIATQYLEALAEFGRHGKGSIVVPHTGSATDVESQVAAMPQAARARRGGAPRHRARAAFRRVAAPTPDRARIPAQKARARARCHLPCCGAQPSLPVDARVVSGAPPAGRAKRARPPASAARRETPPAAHASAAHARAACRICGARPRGTPRRSGRARARQVRNGLIQAQELALPPQTIMGKR